MNHGSFMMERPQNEPILEYRENSDEKRDIKAMMKMLKEETIQIPMIIGGEEIFSDITGICVCPHDHQHVLAEYHKAQPQHVRLAIQACQNAKQAWQDMPWTERVSIFLKAADLLTGAYRPVMNAACMLNQSKTVYQAEIDAVCELADFFRFNAYYLTQIYQDQPFSSQHVRNAMEYRPLEGFVFAITPFNFTSIGGNLPSAPAMAGNTVIWKPSSSSVYSNYFIMKISEDAGMPPGVINFIPGSGEEIGNLVLKHPDLAAVHFTGSTRTFQNIWKTIGEQIASYRSYPRIVGETGGKDYIFVHESANVTKTVHAMIRGAFEYQGQKCSAASRAYIPKSLSDDILSLLKEQVARIAMGDPLDFRNFMCAVIDKKAFEKIVNYIEYAKISEDADLLTGGGYDDSIGYFIEPTIIVTSDPKFRTMKEEIFGPVLTIYIYDNDRFDETLGLCDETSIYALTGAVFAQNRSAIDTMKKRLYHSAGNFYINDKPTGAVVGQQPFGGARGSGTNDKAGSKWNLLRFMSMMTIKENFDASEMFEYPHMRHE